MPRFPANRGRVNRILAGIVICLLFFISVALAQEAKKKVTPAAPAQKIGVLLNLKGVIGPAIQDYVQEGLKKAAQMQAKIVILRMDTPGGLDKSMRGIIRAIIASPVPVVTYVAPSGARAASAGTYILYASHIAAMAPGTNLGAATPVAISFPGTSPADKDKGKSDKDKKTKAKTKPKSAMEQKAINDAKAYIRSLAQMRGRNVKWAERAVSEAASLSATEALKINVINVVAKNIPDLLQQINGRSVELQGQTRTLDTTGLVIQLYEPSWHTRFLSVITNPNVAYILMLLGIYGLFFELANPGFVLPGVVGAICLLLALYAFQLLPINYAGLGLLLLGIAFMVAEAFLPSFGALGIGGVIAFAVGSIMLLKPGVPGFTIALPVVLAVSITTGAFFLLVVNMVLRSRWRPVVSGREEMLGSTGRIIDAEGKRVRIRGEVWQVKSDAVLSQDQLVKVLRMDGLILWVEPLEEKEQEKQP